MVRLIWCRYETTPGQGTNKLLLELGTHEHLIYALDTNMLGRQDISLIRQAATILPKLSLGDMTEWMKDRIPGAMKAIKSYKASNLVVLNTYPLKALE